MTKKTDPADQIKEKKEEERLFDDMEKLDINNLSLSDFKTVPKTRARFVHPMEGYPLAEKIEVGKMKDPNDGRKMIPAMVSATYIIALNPREEPDQDPSGLGMSIIDQKTGKEEKKDLYTPHSRFIRADGINHDIVFDRVLELQDGKVRYAIVPSPEVRAQIMYYYDSKLQRFEVDKRYMFLDMKQDRRLLRLFQLMMRPNIKREKMAAAVSGEVEVTDQELEMLPTEA